MSPNLQSGKKYEVFISYCREDSRLIEPISALLKAGREDLVFFDKSDLRAGKRWEPQLLKALEDVALVFVFWCSHAAQSDYMKKEYTIAIGSGKDIAPVLLDNTSLPEELEEYEWIDFRSLFPAYHENKETASTAPKVEFPIAPDPKAFDYYKKLKASARGRESFFERQKYNWPVRRAVPLSFVVSMTVVLILVLKGQSSGIWLLVMGTVAWLTSWLLLFTILSLYERRLKNEVEDWQGSRVSNLFALRDDPRRVTPGEKLRRSKDSSSRYMAGAILLARLEQIR